MTGRPCRWRWGPRSVPVGNTGSLLHGCRACPLWVGHSELPDEARQKRSKTQRQGKNILTTNLACYSLQSGYPLLNCYGTVWHVHSPQLLHWNSVVAGCNWADILCCPPAAPVKKTSKISKLALNEKQKQKNKVVFKDPISHYAVCVCVWTWLSVVWGLLQSPGLLMDWDVSDEEGSWWISSPSWKTQNRSFEGRANRITALSRRHELPPQLMLQPETRMQ